MTAPSTRTLLLERAAARCERRLLELDRRVESGDETAWVEYLATAAALAAVEPVTQPAPTDRLLTTGELARKLGISSKTLLRKRKAGEVTPALELGRRGERRCAGGQDEPGMASRWQRQW